MLGGKGAPSNLSEKVVQRPVARRKEPFRQFLETPDCCTVGARRVSPWSTPPRSNPLADLGADVKKELIKIERIIRKRGIEQSAQKRKRR